MKTAPKFELNISSFDDREVAIINNLTGIFARQNLKSMTKIKRRFGLHLCDNKDMCFSFMTKENTEKLREMLPKHRIG